MFHARSAKGQSRKEFITNFAPLRSLRETLCCMSPFAVAVQVCDARPIASPKDSFWRGIGRTGKYDEQKFEAGKKINLLYAGSLYRGRLQNGRW